MSEQMVSQPSQNHFRQKQPSEHENILTNRNKSKRDKKHKLHKDVRQSPSEENSSLETVTFTYIPDY